MKNVVFLVLALAVFQANAQDSSFNAPKPKKDWSKINIANRPKDHFLIQLGYNHWTQVPDSINTKGIPRTFNFYFLLDFPFKTDPRISVAIGAGIASDNVYFSKTYIDITGKDKDELTFQDKSDTSHFKKYKLTTAYLEAPLELRFTKNPETPNKSFKAALGVKVGTLLSAGTKGKTFQSSTGTTLNAFTGKEKAKRYFNSSRISAMGRIGYGIFSIYASYQLNAFVKDGFGPDIRPLQVGITISGL